MPTDRRATPEEIETAKAWVTQCYGEGPTSNPDDPGTLAERHYWEQDAKSEYEHALALLVFANDRRRAVEMNAGRPVAWLDLGPLLGGGYVCAVPAPGQPDGICGTPVESEPCGEHPPDRR